MREDGLRPRLVYPAHRRANGSSSAKGIKPEAEKQTASINYRPMPESLSYGTAWHTVGVRVGEPGSGVAWDKVVDATKDPYCLVAVTGCN